MGIIVFALGILVVVPEYGYIKPIPWLELFSSKICERIPILVTSHLDRWKEIRNIIETHEWLNDILKEPVRVPGKVSIQIMKVRALRLSVFECFALELAEAKN